jgi:hypothetical protein
MLLLVGVLALAVWESGEEARAEEARKMTGEVQGGEEGGRGMGRNLRG